MARFGIVSPPVPGHINPFLALATELESRGHRVTFFNMADVAPAVEAEELSFHTLGQETHPPGSLAASLRELARRKGLPALRFTIGEIEKTTAMFCRDGPSAVRQEQIDLLLVDQTEPAGGTIAEQLGLPFVTICNALPLNREPTVPPPFSPLRYRTDRLGRLRNWFGYAVTDLVERPILRTLERYRREAGLPLRASPEQYHSNLAQISQMPRAFDFPRRPGVGLHYAGPFRRQARRKVEFPWDRLDGRPLVYASLGTLQGAHEGIFRCFAEACHDLDLQVVISHGGRLTGAQAKRLSSLATVVGYAPQLELLEKATATITHAGLNTVLDALSLGLPVVAVPLTFEQPGIGARIEFSGVGKVIPHTRLTRESMRRALRELLGVASYRNKAERMRASIRESGGVRMAAGLIEEILRRGGPVPPNDRTETGR